MKHEFQYSKHNDFISWCSHLVDETCSRSLTATYNINSCIY